MTRLGANRILCLSFFALFGWIFWNVVLTRMGNCLVAMAVAVILLLAVLAMRWVLQRCLFHVRPSFLYGAFGLLLVGFTALQLILGGLLMAQPTGALEQLHHGALQWIQQGTVDQAVLNACTPGQRTWMAVLARIYQLVQTIWESVPLFAGVCLNIVAVNLSVVLLFLLCKKLWNGKVALLAGAISVLFLPYYLVGSVFSPDLAVMPLILGAMTLLVYGGQWQGRGCTLSRFGAGVLLGMGTCLKGSVVVLLVALLLYLVLHRVGQPVVAEAWSMMAGALVPMVLLTWMVQGMFRSQGAWVGEQDPPIRVYLLAGLQEQGLEEESVAEILTLPTQQEKVQAASADLKARLDQLGGTGLITYWTGKAASTWGDGTYGLTQTRGSVMRLGLLTQFITPGTTYYGVLEYLCQGIQIDLLFLLWVSLAWGAYRPGWNLLGSLRAGMAGLFLFHLLAPAHPGDLLTYVPLLFLLALDGLNALGRVPWKRVWDDLKYPKL